MQFTQTKNINKNSKSLATKDRLLSTRDTMSRNQNKYIWGTYVQPQKSINKKSITNITQLKSDFPKLKAKAVHLYDYQKKITLYQSNENQKREIASLTKIMTCWVAIQYIRKNDIIPEQVFITVSSRATSLNGTTSQLQEGDRLSLWDLLHGLMLPSGNDAALCIAEAIGAKLEHKKKSRTENFIQQMNLWATHFGMKNTFYCNPHGLANRLNRSTASDQAILVQKVLQDKLITKIIEKRIYFCSVQQKDGWTRQLFWQNTNKLLYRGFSGVKTGSTTPAGFCLASWYKNDGVNMLVIVLGCPSDEIRYDDSLSLVRWAIKQNKILKQDEI